MMNEVAKYKCPNCGGELLLVENGELECECCHNRYSYVHEQDMEEKLKVEKSSGPYQKEETKSHRTKAEKRQWELEEECLQRELEEKQRQENGKEKERRKYNLIRKTKKVLKVAVPLTVVFAIALTISLVVINNRKAYNYKYNYKNIEISVLGKSNYTTESTLYSGPSVTSSVEFEFKILNKSNIKVLDIYGDLQINNFDDEVLSHCQTQFSCDLSPGSYKTMLLKIDTESDELFYAYLEDLNIYYRITSIRFGDYRTKEYNYEFEKIEKQEDKIKYNYKNMEISVLGKSKYTTEHYEPSVEFEFEISNKSDVKVLDLYGDLQINNFDDEVLLYRPTQFSCDLSPGSYKTMYLQIDNIFDELIYADLEELNIYYRITSIRFGDYRTKEYNCEFEKIKQATMAKDKLCCSEWQTEFVPREYISVARRARGG